MKLLLKKIFGNRPEVTHMLKSAMMTGKLTFESCILEIMQKYRSSLTMPMLEEANELFKEKIKQ